MGVYEVYRGECDEDESDNNIETAAAALGGEVLNAVTVRCPSPGRPSNDLSMVVKIYSGGRFFIYDCEGPSGAAYAFVRERLKLLPPRPAVSLNKIREIQSRTWPLRGTTAEKYLKWRGITLLPADLLYHHELYHSGDRTRRPAMIGVRKNVAGEVVALHRTYLRFDGQGKAPVEPPRMDLGSTMGTAVRLGPLAAELVVGEGIETVLSVMQVAGKSGWAAGSAIALRKLELPPEVRRVVVLVDGDPAGESASAAAASRWKIEGRAVELARAPQGKDFNDLLIEEVGR
jgi:putative DNA primase/helicase